jgi:putative transposase
MKYAFIRAHQTEFHVRAMCRVLRVHFSGFYAWLKEPLSRRAQEDARQTGLIRQAWSESGKVYGYRKLADDLRDQGEHGPCFIAEASHEENPSPLVRRP